MKLNNRGFAVSTIMYMIFVLAVLVMAITLTILNSRKLILDKQRNIAIKNIYDNSVATHRTDCSTISSFGGTYVAPTGADTHKGIIYMNPIDPTAVCNATIAGQNVNEYGKPTGVTAGCMKFYIFDDSGEYYKMILDHNTSGNLAWANHDDYIEAGGTEANWADNKTNILGPVTALKRLSTDTAGWIGNPRLISANELAHIVGADSAATIKWDSSKVFTTSTTFDPDVQVSWFYLSGSGTTYSEWQIAASSTNKSQYAWLYDYTYGCVSYGCNFEDNNQYPYPLTTSTTKNGVFGYWTATPIGGSESSAYRVYRPGDLHGLGVHNNPHIGIRPVITIEKSIIGNN